MESLKGDGQLSASEVTLIHYEEFPKMWQSWESIMGCGELSTESFHP
jgi:hypothetical protein